MPHYLDTASLLSACLPLCLARSHLPLHLTHSQSPSPSHSHPIITLSPCHQLPLISLSISLPLISLSASPSPSLRPWLSVYPPHPCFLCDLLSSLSQRARPLTRPRPGPSRRLAPRDVLRCFCLCSLRFCPSEFPREKKMYSVQKRTGINQSRERDSLKDGWLWERSIRPSSWGLCGWQTVSPRPGSAGREQGFGSSLRSDL